ncbi:MAG: 16S rRNA (guanine(527)-N(7))-methyltransferase RsmG [Nodosilinea sp.]
MGVVEQLPTHPQAWLTTLQWQPDTDQQRAFQTLYEVILATNQQVNLTRITAPDDFWEKHLWDSLQGISPWLADAAQADTHRRVIDIGTGGGFPGLPIALVFPHWQLSLMDSTRKKIVALEAVVQTLGLTHVSLLPERAEQVGHQPAHREAYDLALVRAVGSANTCAEYALPLLKPSGRAVLYRGQWTQAEEASLAAILPRLGGQLLEVRAVTTPLTQGFRHNIDVEKVAPTPNEYPRRPGIPAKTPLI